MTRPGQAFVRARIAPKQHWIMIEMVGEDDSPLKDEPYHITLPDGSVKEGNLDGKGSVMIEDILVPGDCIVTFPELDSEAWESL